MRSHAQIVTDHGASKLQRDLRRVGVVVHLSTPQRWAERNSIPGEYWPALGELGVASLEELASAADVRSPATNRPDGKGRTHTKVRLPKKPTVSKSEAAA